MGCERHLGSGKRVANLELAAIEGCIVASCQVASYRWEKQVREKGRRESSMLIAAFSEVSVVTFRNRRSIKERLERQQEATKERKGKE